MSELTKKINQFFRLATRKEVQEIKDKIYISEHLEQVFNMYYIQKKSIGYIADIIGYDISKINRDLRLLREKINRLL
jgi:DNA-directed RNA polymerase specialized sigma24 family protein